MSRILTTTTRTVFGKTFSTTGFGSLSQQHTNKMETFTKALASLGVNDLPAIAAAHPSENPLDIFRSHIAERLAPLAGIAPDVVFGGLDRSTKPETGDFVLAVPRLRLKTPGGPVQLASQLQSQVRA
jgi:arginyl-tRNA synthetase